MYVCTDSPAHTTEEIADAADACTRPATPELLWAVIAGLDFQLLSCVFPPSMHVGLAAAVNSTHSDLADKSRGWSYIPYSRLQYTESVRRNIYIQ